MYLDKHTFTGKRAVAYLRKSTDDAYRQKYSIQSQREQMELWCEHFGVIVEKYFVDDHSAKDFKRPGWKQLMDYLRQYRKNVQLVLIIDYSRFSRNDVAAYVSIDQLDRWGIELQAIDQLLNYEVPESLIMRGNYITMPAVDNKWRSIKVKRGMIQSLKAGNWCAGKMPRGYWRDKNTGEIKLTEEGRLISRTFDKIANHGYNIRDAQVYLNLRGVNVTFKALSKILRNPFYKGMISHTLLGDETVRGNQPMAVDPTTWQIVQDILDGNKKGGRREDLFPLKQFLSCSRCGRLFTGYMVSKKQKPDGTYREKKSKPIFYKCQCSNVSGRQLHEGFAELLSSLCLDPGDVQDLRTEMEQVFFAMQDESRESVTVMKRRVTELHKFLDQLERKYIQGDLDTETYRKHRQSTEDEIRKLQEKVNGDVQLSNPTRFIDHCMRLLTKMSKIWQESDVIDQRRLQKLVFPEGLSYDKPKAQYLTPRVNSIFTLIDSLSVGKKHKTRSGMTPNLVYSLSAVPTSHKSNPSNLFIEDFINISNETLLAHEKV